MSGVRASFQFMSKSRGGLVLTCTCVAVGLGHRHTCYGEVGCREPGLALYNTHTATEALATAATESKYQDPEPGAPLAALADRGL